MINIQWGDFTLYADGSVAVLVVAIPLFLIMQIPTIQKAIQFVVRRIKASKKTKDIANRVQQEEKR